MFILAYFFETHVYEDRFKTFLENAYYEKNLHEFKKKSQHQNEILIPFCFSANFLKDIGISD